MTLLDAQRIEKFRAWLDAARAPCAAVITSEVTGSGVSHMVRDVCARMNIETVTVSHPARMLRTVLKDATGSARTVFGARKVLVIDPLDAVLAEPTSAGDLSDFLKSGRSKVPVIVAGVRSRSSASKLRDMLKPRVWDLHETHFPALEESAVLVELARVNPDVPAATVHRAWRDARGDLGHALKTLEAGFGTGHAKDRVVDGTDAIAALLFGTVSVFEGARIIEGDSKAIASGVHENYPLTGQDVHTCAEIADAFSTADLMDEHIYGNQRFDMAPVYDAVCAGAGGVLAKPTDRRPFAVERYGTVWSKHSMMRTRQKSVRGIRAYLLEAGRTTLTAQELGAWRSIGLDDETPADVRSKVAKLTAFKRSQK